MAERWNVDDLTAAWAARGLSRRELMQLLAAGAGASVLLTLATTPPAGAAQGEVTPAASGGQVSMLWSKPTTLHPLFSTAGFEQQVERLMFGALIKMTDDLEQVPDLAESVDVAPDATVYTFTLRPGITFNDGTPLTTRDVIFTFERAVDSRTGAYWRGRLLGIAGAEAYGSQQAETISGLEAVDDRTLRVTLAAPDSAFLPNLGNFSGLGILPAHVLQDVAPDQLRTHPFALAPTVSAGAFSFVRYETDQFLELARNPTYVGGPPPLERIFLRILQPDVALAELERGGLDLMNVSLEDVERLQTIPTLTVVSVPSPSMDSISVNLDRPYFQDKRIRQAMMHALDRETIVAQIYRGQAELVHSPIFGPEWMGKPDVNPYPYDPDRARQLLAEAGWDSGRTVEMMYVPGGNRTFETMVPVVQAQFADVGINVELVQLDAPELNRRLVQESDYDLYIGGGGVYRADPSISGTYYQSQNLTPAGANNTRYVNPTIDDLYRQGRAVSEPAERQRIYTEIARILNEDLPSIFLWSPNSNFAFNNRLQGFQPPSYVYNQLWNAETWSVAG